MSRPWHPGEEIARAHAAQPTLHWPHGATAGVALGAIGCVGLALLLYRLAGPRDVFGG